MIIPPMIVTPAAILIFFIIFSLKNPTLSGGVSVDGEVGDGGGPSGAKDDASPSDVECCEGIGVKSYEGINVESCQGIGVESYEGIGVKSCEGIGVESCEGIDVESCQGRGVESCECTDSHAEK